MENEIKNRITFLSFLRIFGVLFVVFWHTFCSYGPWQIINIKGFSFPNLMIDIMNPFVAMMPFLTFLSGYLFSKLSLQGKYGNFLILVKNKFARLITPMLIFSFMPSFLIFIDKKDIVFFIDNLLNGQNHLWYMSMLFWCFIVQYYLVKILNNYLSLIILLITFSFIYIEVPNHLGLHYFFKLFFYFHLGHIYNLFFLRIIIFFSKKRIFFISILFFASLFIVVYNSRHLIIGNDILGKLLLAVMSNYIRLSFILISFLVIYKLDVSGRLNYSNQLKDIDNSSFGIYIFHGFLIPIFFSEPFINIAFKHQIIYPFFVFITVSFCSYFLTYLVRITKFGRLILG